MSSSMKQLLETMCGGDFMSKNLEEAMDFLNYVVEVSKGWDELNRGEVGRMKSQPNALNAKAGMYTLNEDIDMKAKVAAMTRRLEEIELKKICEVQAVSETPMQVMPCFIGQSYEHLVEECPKIPAVREMFGDQANKIDNLQYSISRLTNLNTVQEKGRFPSQPHQNPKGIHEVEAHEGESSQVRDVKAMITLRSGKEVELQTPKPHDETESEKEIEKREEIKGKNKGSSGRKEDHDSIVNEDPEKIVINEDCKSPVKYKDLGCLTISVMIGEKLVEKALLDLGASVNLLAYSVYKQLGLGELKPTSVTLSLADRSMKIPRGMIEDVLVQVDNFYYPVDFVVLDTDPIVKGTNYVPIILGRPFLATSNAIINYRNGLMQLTFGNMTFELNIFYMYKNPINPEEEEGPEEGIIPLVCTHHIYMEEEAKPVCQPQRRLNPHMQEVVRVEVLKLLQAGIIYPILDSPWVSPTQVVPEKSGIIVVQNDKGEEVATRLTSG
uniref:Uncharacterized protein n=1 Tax=Vitis vinifera TaxID=29760 RepID=A5BTS1_VITVI|nr:hypothetical protein VITISV_013032 [Vitis vinifera]